MRDPPRPESRHRDCGGWDAPYLGLLAIWHPVKPITLSADPALQKVVKFHDLNDGRFAVDTLFDVEPIIDESTAIRNAQPDGWKGNEHLVAQIPMPIWQALRMTWKALGLSTADQQAALKRFLNDPDNAKFRTKRGKL